MKPSEIYQACLYLIAILFTMYCSYLFIGALFFGAEPTSPISTLLVGVGFFTTVAFAMLAVVFVYHLLNEIIPAALKKADKEWEEMNKK